MNIVKLFPSKYVTAVDIAKEITLQMRAVQVERMGNPPEEKPVLYFVGATKGLILNRTNALTIANAYGPETDAWKGKRVTLYSTQVKAFGKVQDAVRVRIPQSQTVPPEDRALDDVEDVVDDNPWDE